MSDDRTPSLAPRAEPGRILQNHEDQLMGAAFTNEERFIASCKTAGETDVRQKLGAGRYSERRAEWASAWLEELETGKSDATRAEERNVRLLKPSRSAAFLRPLVLTLVLGTLIASVVVYLDLW